MDKITFERNLKKYNIVEEANELYTKTFFITNTDSDKLGSDMNYELLECSKLIVTDDDIVEVMFNGFSGNNIGTFILTVKEKHLNYKIRVGQLVFKISDAKDWNQVVFYNKISMDIARILKNKRYKNITINYNMWFIKDECTMYMIGCERLKDEVEALKYIKEPCGDFKKSDNFRENDTLLLYSSYGLKTIYENIEVFKSILAKYGFSIKGLFYTINEFKLLEPLCNNKYQMNSLERLEGPAKALYIDIDEISESEYDKVVDAVLEIHKELGVKPFMYVGYDLISKATEDHVEENVDYNFMKDFNVGKLLLSDIEKYPDRFYGNYMKNVEISTYCLSNYDDFFDIYTYQLSKNIFNVYVDICDDDEFKRTLGCHKVDISEFSIEELNYIISMLDKWSLDTNLFSNKHYKEVYDLAMSEESYENLESMIAAFIIINKYIFIDSGSYECDEEEDYPPDSEEYYIVKSEESIKEKTNKYTEYKIVVEEDTDEKILNMYNDYCASDRKARTENQIIGIETSCIPII